MTAASEIIMEKKRNYAPYEKNPDFQEKYPETQTRPKKPRSSGKNPAVVTLAIAILYEGNSNRGG